MRTEIVDIAKSTVLTTGPWIGAAWITKLTLTEWIALAAFLIQTIYLLRKWWREETEWGMKLKRWAYRHGITRPSPLEHHGEDD